MSGYFAAGRLSETEKTDILKLHKSVYDGYRTMQPEVKNEQPLYVYDPAQDKVGAVMSNKGEVKPYTNVGINESTEQKEVCDECGSMMMEGECTECGWKGEVGDMEEGALSDLGHKAKNWMDKPFSPDIEDYISRVLDIIDNPEKKHDKEEDEEEEFEFVEQDSDEPSFMDKAWDTAKDVGMFVAQNPEILAALEEEGEMDEETGHLDDIYHEEDLNPSDEFDYVKGASNKTNAFHMKEDDGDDYVNYMDNIEDFENPDNEDDGFEDLNTGEMDEQGYTGGGNAPDMDISNVKSAYDFVSNGPDEVFPTEGEMDEEECDECWEKMESAWSEEVDEQDISGTQGIYGDMDPAYDFDSEGPGKAGPYQHNQYTEGETDEQYLPVHAWKKAQRKMDAKNNGEDFDDDELDISDYEDFDPETSSWEDVVDLVGGDEFGHVDEDIRESVINQKNKIMEMMNRMKVIK